MSRFEKFSDLTLHEDLHRALEKMNFVEPTPIQQQTIEQTLLGRDVLGCAQTGTGKTGAFGIPLVNFLLQNPDKKALILAPTRELADQIHRTLQQLAFFAYDLKIALIIGGASLNQQVRNLSQGARIIVATPGRLIDILGQRKVDLGNVGILVLDEVDRMLDMGFAPQLKQIVPHLPKEKQAMLFSATLPPEIKPIAESYLKDPVRVTVGEANTAANTVEQMMIQTQQDSKQHLLFKQLPSISGKTIVFVRTQHGTERLAKAVRLQGYRADRLHGGRSHVQRKRALENFRRGEVQLLIATDIAGRGIDIDDIEYVINYDMPKTHEDYIHRIGRTGRLGRKGTALNFVTMDDLDLMRILDPDTYPSRRGPSSGQRRPQGQGQNQRSNAGAQGQESNPNRRQPQHRRDGGAGVATRGKGQHPGQVARGGKPQASRPETSRKPERENTFAGKDRRDGQHDKAKAPRVENAKPQRPQGPRPEPIEATNHKVKRAPREEAAEPSKKKGLLGFLRRS